MNNELKHISWRDEIWLRQNNFNSTSLLQTYFLRSPFCGKEYKKVLEKVEKAMLKNSSLIKYS